MTVKGFKDSLHKSVKLRECSNFAILLSSAGILNRNPILFFTKKKRFSGRQLIDSYHRKKSIFTNFLLGEKKFE